MSKQNLIKLVLDLSTFTAFLILMQPRNSGIAVHEWLAIALAATIVVHLLLNWNWIVEVTARLFAKRLNGSAVNYVLNWLLFIDGILIVLSGLMISQAVVPALGISLPQNFTWRSLHELTSNLSLLLLGLHVAMHWKWIVTTVTRLFPRQSRGTARAIPLKREDVSA